MAMAVVENCLGLTWIHVLSLLILDCHPSISSEDKDAEGKMLTKAVAKALERNVKLSLSGDAAIVNASKAAEMEEAAQVSSLEGYREYASFVFIFIAFLWILAGCRRILVLLMPTRINQQAIRQ